MEYIYLNMNEKFSEKIILIYFMKCFRSKQNLKHEYIL